VNEFLSLVRARFERNRDQAVLVRLREDAGYVAEVVAGRLHLRQCDSVGPWVRVVGRPRVENLGHVEIGTRTRLVCDIAPVELKTGPQGTIRIGSQGAINFGTAICAAASVTIGNRASIGPYCIISDTDVGETDGPRNAEPIVIGDDVWLATRVTVLPGARIGNGSVITAGSVVFGDIPHGVVAGGNPARVLRQLRGEPSDDPSARTSENGEATTGHSREANEPAPPGRQETPSPPAHRGLLISDFTIDDLGRYLESDGTPPTLGAAVAPFGQVIPTLMQDKHPEHDYAVVWTRPEAVLPSFARVLDFEQVSDDALLVDVDEFASRLIEGLKSYRFAFVATWTVPPWRRGLGVADGRANGVTRALCRANERLLSRLGNTSNVFVMNAQRWCSEVGRDAHSAKLWYLGKVPFHTRVFEQAAHDVKAAIQGLTGMTRKLVIVDLDDTLWGGILGDVGWERLRLGGHDSVGEAFVDFQRALRSLKRRGILLALVSKNDEASALEAIRRHGEMVLKEADFVGWRINWKDKATNIADLVASLNLGLQSAVFIDDNPFERARVREALPDVFVPEWPDDKLAYAKTLLALRCFDAPTLSAEDAARTEMYASDRKRDELRAQVGSVDEWLMSLGLRVRVEPVSASNRARTAQLLNKTNQMNLSTRRLTEQELVDWAASDRHFLRVISVSDRLGDAGLTGILSLQIDGGVARIVDFVLSCRVMGRRVEETMLHLAVDRARKLSLSTVEAELLPTAKNAPCLEFLRKSGFREESHQRFVWDARDEYTLPAAVSLEAPG
jgi:FkbH-like protein